MAVEMVDLETVETTADAEIIIVDVNKRRE